MANLFSSTLDGILAALLSPFFMSLGFFIWDSRWTASGASAFALNMYKCNVASIGFIIMCLVRGFESTASLDANNDQSVFTITSVGFLILSSTLGIIVGDVLWLEALRLLGAKHVIVIDSLKPFIAAILGWIALDEVLLPPAWGGMALTVLGVGAVAWEEQRISAASQGNTNIEEDGQCIAQNEIGVEKTAATDRIEFSNEEDATIIQITNAVANESTETIPSGKEDNTVQSDSKQPSANDTTSGESNIERKHYKRGYICAFVNVLADSLGSLLTKQHGVGMYMCMSTWSINLIRFGFAGITLIFISAGMRLRKRCSQTTESKPNTSQEAECIDPSKAADADTDTAVGEAAAPQWFELPSMTRIGWMYITAGVGFVTFLCPALSNYALFQIALGMAVSLSSIGPLYGLLLDWPFKGKRPTMSGCAGVLLTIAGVIILCVWGTQ